ncbi:MAG: hypothetical protein Q7S12_03445 [bacterium]|nr:hypothetical protein [bacterium]
MKTILCLLLVGFLLINASIARANHIPVPNLPIGETAYKIGQYDWKCGKAVWYDFTDWYIITINGKLVLIGKRNSDKVWVDRDSDGHFDEFYDDGDNAFEAKYHNICDIIEKGAQE